MERKKRIKLLAIWLTVGLTMLSFMAIFFLFSPLYDYVFLPVVHYERKWDIDLPNSMTLEYKMGETYIDGGLSYHVFTLKKPLNEELLSKSDLDIEKEKFESWVKSAINIQSFQKEGKEEYYPNFSEDYRYFCYSKKEHRALYLYIIYFPSTNKLIICEETRQYVHS